MREGWKCPSCGKAHGPHIDTCPGGGTEGIDFSPPDRLDPSHVPYPMGPVKHPEMWKWVPPLEVTCGRSPTAVDAQVFHKRHPQTGVN